MNVEQDATVKFLLGCFSSLMVGAMGAHAVAYGFKCYGPWIEGCKKRHHQWRKKTKNRSPRETGKVNGVGGVDEDVRFVNPPVTARVWVSKDLPNALRGNHWWNDRTRGEQ
jgi:hypothetical protein